MTDTPKLSIAFIETRPDNAAVVLEGMDAEDAVALIDILPGRIAGMALGHMTPLAAAHCIELLEPTRAALVIRSMNFQDAASVLRITAEDKRSALMQVLPSNLARDFSKSLSYPKESVGAWMNQATSPLVQTRSVAEALKYARQKRRPPGDELFVTDSAQRYVGIVRISELLKVDGKTTLKEVADTAASTFSSRSSLASISQDEAWDRYASLAVVGRKQNFLGVLSRAQMRDGILARRRVPFRDRQNSILAHMIGAFSITLVAMFSLLLQSHSVGNPGGNNRER